MLSPRGAFCKGVRMKIERRKNAKRNIVYGFSLRMFQTLVPFALRTVLINTLGMQFVGLDTLFVSILHVLNLVELGVGNAMVYCMYEPIAYDNTTKLNAILNLYKKYYRIIGLVVLLLGIAIIPFLPDLIKDEIPEGINLYVLYLINLIATVLSYWMFAYKTSVLLAHQRTDVYSRIQFFSFAVRYAIQLASLILFRSFYAYMMAVLVSQALTNCITAIVTQKRYPQYIPQGRLEKSDVSNINSHIKDLFTAKLGGTVTNSADTVVISAFLGLTTLAVYNNYYYVLTALFGFLTIIFHACLAGIGNSLVVESSEKNYRDFEKFSLMLTWIIGFCTACLYCLLQPFMKIWVHKENMLDNSFVPLFCVYFYVYELALIWATYKDAGGIWHKDRFRPLCVTIVNLGLNVLTVRYWGLYGVLLSTIVSYTFVGMPWMLQNVFSTLFKRPVYGYLFHVAKGMIATFLGCFASGLICTKIPIGGLGGLVLRLAIPTVVANMVFLVFFWRSKEFSEIVHALRKKLGIAGKK